MRSVHRLGILVLVAVVALGGKVGAGDPALPTIRGKKALAAVNGEPVTLEELLEQLEVVHASARETGSPIPKQNPSELLHRLINARLILQEAERIGLGDVPEVASALADYERNALRDALFQRHVGGLTEGDPAEVERLYRDAIKEINVRSVLFGNEADARAMTDKVKAGGDFEALAKDAVAAGKGTGGAEGQYAKIRDLLPDVRAAVSRMTPGEVSAPIRIEKSYAVVKLVDVRFPDDLEAKRKVQAQALEARRLSELRKYVDSLRSQYAKVNQKLLDGVDFDAKEEGFGRLLQDQRAVAELKGEAPITVALLADTLQKTLFHGVDQAAEKKRLNRRKNEVLDDMIAKRVVVKEAKRLKLDQTARFKDDREAYRKSLLFGVFVQKVVDPGIQVDDAELKKYMDSHIADYTSPEMMKIESLAFRKKSTAEDAIAKLRKGADIKWIRANAEGQADPKSDPGVLEFPGGLVATSELPEGVQKAVAGSRPGDYRFFGQGDGPFHILWIRDVVSSRPQPFEVAKEGLTQKVILQKREQAVEDWAARLRQASEIKVFVNGDALSQILMQQAGVGK